MRVRDETNMYSEILRGRSRNGLRAQVARVRYTYSPSTYSSAGPYTTTRTLYLVFQETDTTLTAQLRFCRSTPGSLLTGDEGSVPSKPDIAAVWSLCSAPLHSYKTRPKIAQGHSLQSVDAHSPCLAEQDKMLMTRKALLRSHCSHTRTRTFLHTTTRTSSSP